MTDYYAEWLARGEALLNRARELVAEAEREQLEALFRPMAEEDEDE